MGTPASLLQQLHWNCTHSLDMMLAHVHCMYYEHTCGCTCTCTCMCTCTNVHVYHVDRSTKCSYAVTWHALWAYTYKKYSNMHNRIHVHVHVYMYPHVYTMYMKYMYPHVQKYMCSTCTCTCKHVHVCV